MMRLRLSTHQRPVQTTAKRLFSAGAALVICVASAGCRNELDAYSARVLSDPEKNHAFNFSSETETLFVELPHGGRNLSHNQSADVRRFVERFKAESTGNIKIAAPRAMGGRFAVARSMRQVEDIVAGAGIPSSVIQVQDYSGSNPEFGPALRLAYRRPVALPPHCEDFSKDMGVDRERLPTRNFGCASQRNLALMVANSRDLRHPQPLAQRSSERRSVTWTEYVGTRVGSGSGSSGATTPPTTQSNSSVSN